jgi:hypothetical protein
MRLAEDVARKRGGREIGLSVATGNVVAEPAAARLSRPGPSPPAPVSVVMDRGIACWPPRARGSAWA